MPDSTSIESIVERVVGEAFETHTTQLHREIVRRVMEEIAVSPATNPVASPTTAGLARAVSEIQVGSSQKEILRALLDSSSNYAARVALFVVKGSRATGWQARGFADCDAVRDFALDSSAPAVARAIADHAVASLPAPEFDTQFTERFGAPASGEVKLFPLILKEKVAALLYADCGDGALLDASALEVLVLATSAWLEVNALRKQAHKDGSAAPGEGQLSPGPEPATAFNDPFAAHAPAFAMAAAASADSHTTVAVAATETAPAAADVPPEVIAEPQTAGTEVQSAAAPGIATEPLPTGSVQAEVATEVTPETSSAATPVSEKDQEVFRKAQRFARLLVDEIKLYNQAEVSEGRKNKDLYDRLKDAIEKSRKTYQKRYGSTVAASADYFQHELIRSLAEDDVTSMGPNFRV